MEEYLKYIPEISQKRFLKRYNTDVIQRKELINEIIIGGFIAKAGFEIEYDRKINNQTPDWTILKNGEPQCIIEIFTHNPKRDFQKFEELTIKLTDELKKIKGDKIVKFEISDNTDQYKALKNLNEIKNEVKKWISNKRNNILKCNPFQINFEMTDFHSKTGFCDFISLTPIEHDVVRLENSINDKIERYKLICEKYDLPLIIGVASDILNLVDEIEINKLLFGTRMENRFFGENFSIHYMKGGLFQKYKNLFSGFIWAPFELKIKNINLYLNQYGENKLFNILKLNSSE